jgi:hypothetical protein
MQRNFQHLPLRVSTHFSWHTHTYTYTQTNTQLLIASIQWVWKCLVVHWIFYLAYKTSLRKNADANSFWASTMCQEYDSIS